MNSATELANIDRAAEQRVRDDEAAAKQAHAIVCRLAADPNLDPAMANALARAAGRGLSKRFDESAPSAFGAL